MNSSLTVSFSPEPSISSSSGRGSKWAHLEQEYKEDLAKTANLYDVQQMLGLAKAGESPFSYIADGCKYITRIDTVSGSRLIIYLDFYVWPSQIHLPYNLSTETGFITGGLVHSESTKFYLVFNGSSYEEMDFIFSGSFTPEMPLIRPDGSKMIASLPVAEGTTPNVLYMDIQDSSVTLSEPIYTVFRASGRKHGYKHTLVMTLSVINGYKIENLQNSVTLKYIDENNEEQIEVLDLEIPPCVEDLIATCPGDDSVLKYNLTIEKKDDHSNDTRVIYVNTCDGSIIEERWEEGYTVKITETPEESEAREASESGNPIPTEPVDPSPG